jgi:preprotein translocase subunit SecE
MANLTQRWTDFKEFMTDVRKEAGKVSWPQREEVMGTTTVVIIYTAIVGVFLFAVDAVVTPLMNKLFSAFGG